MFWIAITLVFVTLAIAVFAKRQRSRDGDKSFLYRRRPAVFSPAERSFLGVLDQAIGKDFRVFGKVRVSDLLAPQDGMNYSARTAAQNKINSKHFDFVLCKPGDLTVLCVIELNDRTHRQNERQDRDRFLVDACHSAGLPLIMFEARYAYSPAEISARIAEVIAATMPKHVEAVLQTSARKDIPFGDDDAKGKRWG